MPVPFIGRLQPAEYVALVGSFLLVGLEALIRVLTLALPPSLLNLFYLASRRLFNKLISPAAKRAEERRKSISTSVRNASDFVDLCALYGYYAEEHVIQTKDGYLLCAHRLAWRKGEDPTTTRAKWGPQGSQGPKKRVVYMHHGLLMNSEVWVCLTDAQRALPFTLVEMGFDVWLGNNRGNKYSKKSIHHPPTSVEFWNFSMDEFAFYDIPNTIQYILETTSQPSLSYIGFSQGTAQAFAALSIHPKLNEQVNVFIALAPAMSPAGLATGIVDSLVKASPSVLYLLFGRRSILASATMWENILYPPIFVRLLDSSLRFLFNWKAMNIATSQKLAAYPHLYSFTSTKSVVHWFQIMRNKSFQMYDDDVHSPISLGAASKYTKVAKFPTRNIRTPIVLVYGGSDSLIDIQVMLKELPDQTMATEIPHYEHLDFLWARDVNNQVFPHIFDALEAFAGEQCAGEERDTDDATRVADLSALNLPISMADENVGSDASSASDVSGTLDGQEDIVPGQEANDMAPKTKKSISDVADPVNEDMVSILEQVSPAPTTSMPAELASPVLSEVYPCPATPMPVELASPVLSEVLTPPPAKTRGNGARRSSLASVNFDRGISIGASKAVGSVQKEGAEGKLSPSPSSQGISIIRNKS